MRPYDPGKNRRNGNSLKTRCVSGMTMASPRWSKATIVVNISSLSASNSPVNWQRKGKLKSYKDVSRSSPHIYAFKMLWMNGERGVEALCQSISSNLYQAIFQNNESTLMF